MTATRFQMVLIGIMIAIIVAGGASYYFSIEFLSQKAVEADHAKIDATLSHSDVDKLKAPEQQLISLQDVVTKAQDIVGNATDFKYQDQVIGDINALAAANGVGITGYSFPPAAAGPTATPKAGSLPLPAGIKQVTVTINTTSPLPYTNYLKFLRALELNLTHLQVTGINVTPDSADPSQVTNSSIGVQMYVRG